MAITSYESYIDVFSPNVITLAEQEYSAIKQIPMRKETVEGRAKFIDRVGGGVMTQRTSYLEPKDYQQVNRSRIKLETIIGDRNAPITSQDIKRALTNPQSIETQAMARAYASFYDDLFLSKIVADVTLEDGSALTFADDGGETILNGGTGLTKAKLDAVNVNFLENEILQPGINKYLILSPFALNSLLDDDEIKNKDYITSAQSAIYANGGSGDLFGFNVIVKNNLPKAGDIRDCYVLTDKAMVEGTTTPFSITMSEIANTKGNPISVDSEVCQGFVRTEGKHAQLVQIDES
ncbi:MAG: phage capsid protein [Nanoarchaeota archaeon]|nr:phage capsid protein [Nanoarchaeota archaeon]